MVRVLIINLTRFGDLLQTQPVIGGLRAQGHKVGLLCLENFAPAAALLDGVDYLAMLPGGAVLAHLGQDWRVALHDMEDMFAEIQQTFPMDVVFNTTATLGARLLARRLAAPQEARVWGFGLDSEGFGISGDMWATFLQGTSTERLNCPFNIVDMFRMAACVGSVTVRSGLRAPDANTLLAAEQRLAASSPPGAQGYVTFQLGASETRRQWPVEYFADLGAKLWQEWRLCPVLVGSAGERSLAQNYAALAQDKPFVDCIGSTDVPQLAALLRHSRLLVSNDTGTLHLAAGLNVPVLGIFLATAQPWDTGPYLPNCCSLEPALPCHPCPFLQPCSQSTADCAQPCLRRIRPDTVATLIRGYVQEGCWPMLAQDEARIWLSCTDATGLADLLCLSGHDEEERTVWLRMQRYFYRQILELLGGQRPQEQAYPIPVPLSLSFRAQVSTTLRQTEELLYLLSEQVSLAQRMPGSPVARRVLGTCGRVHTVLEQCPPLRALAHLWQVLSQERGAELPVFLDMVGNLRQGLAQWRATLEYDGAGMDIA